MRSLFDSMKTVEASYKHETLTNLIYKIQYNGSAIFVHLFISLSVHGGNYWTCVIQCATNVN